jgi:hypothetical protein
VTQLLSLGRRRSLLAPFAPSLAGTEVDPDDPAGLSVAVALTHELEMYLPLTSRTTTAPTTAVLTDLEVQHAH